MYRLVPTLVREMGRGLSRAGRAEALISETLKLEETRFRKTLERGLGLLDEASAGLGRATPDGETAFKLYDTYGFPLDLTQDALRRAASMSTPRRSCAMERQRAEARAHWAGSGDAARKPSGSRSRMPGATEFPRLRHAETAEGVIGAGSRWQAEVETPAGEEVDVVVNQTPFYGESGGQQGDQGTISGEGYQLRGARHAEARRWRVRHRAPSPAPLKPASLASWRSMVIRAGRIRPTIRPPICCMRRCAKPSAPCGAEGLAGRARRLRFDFSHPKPIEADELAEVETWPTRSSCRIARWNPLMAVDERH
jgi:alanyl-tRNA synthetase